MPKRSSNPQDENQIAARTIASIGEDLEVLGKNPAAVELGRLGGLKGGKARAAQLSPRRRSQIARKAAQTRWARRRKK
jgi:hypothetical protein